jgi:hypothetical protein
MGTIVALATLLGTSLGLWWEVKDSEEYSLEVIFVPAVCGFVGAVVSFVLVLAAHFLFRYVTQKAPSGSARNFIDLGKTRDEIVRVLHEANPGGVHNLMQIHFDNETFEFLQEVADLFSDAGWEMPPNQELRLTNERVPTDVEVRLPTGGNTGLEAFVAFLKRLGYKAAVKPSEYDGAADGAGSPTAHIYVGEATH